VPEADIKKQEIFVGDDVWLMTEEPGRHREAKSMWQKSVKLHVLREAFRDEAWHFQLREYEGGKAELYNDGAWILQERLSLAKRGRGDQPQINTAGSINLTRSEGSTTD
jgi:hypothetical protein